MVAADTVPEASKPRTSPQEKPPEQHPSTDSGAGATHDKLFDAFWDAVKGTENAFSGVSSYVKAAEAKLGSAWPDLALFDSAATPDKPPGRTDKATAAPDKADTPASGKSDATPSVLGSYIEGVEHRVSKLLGLEDPISLDKLKPLEPSETAKGLGPIADAIVRIDVNVNGEAGQGTGFMAKSDGTIVTAYHVIDQAKGPIRIDLPNGKVVYAKVVGTDPANDLAVLKIENGKDGEYPTLSISDDAHASNTDTAYGYEPGSNSLQQRSGLSEGQISRDQIPIGDMQDNPAWNDRGKSDWYDGMTAPGGFSGGPILNDKGEVVSMENASHLAGRDSFTQGIPAQAIKALLERIEHKSH